jgi:serine/threonine-protein kinase
MTDDRSNSSPPVRRARVGSRVIRIDDACDRYEAGWVSGPRPRIEQFLDQVAAIERPSLLRELLAIELEIRRGRGEAPTVQEYLTRFPDNSALVNDAFTSARSTVTAVLERNMPQALQAGVLDGRNPGVKEIAGYQILDELGRGGMGVVFRARHVALGRTVALKMIRAAHLASEAERQRFRIEAEAAAALDHPNIVPIYEVGECAGRLYYTMKLVEGGCLAQWLAQNVPKPHDAALIVAQAARAVGAAHGQGILHRDLKPANILIDRDGKPHITDFGLAKRIGVDCELTEPGALVGTPSYMSPEQAGGSGRGLTTASDVYSLGAILYRLITGRPPFRGDSVMQTLHDVRERTPDRPRSLDPTLHRDLETICLKCLEKPPERRYRSADSLAEDLARWLRGEPIAARAVGPIERAALWCRRNKLLAGLSAALASALIVGFAAVCIEWRRAEANYRDATTQRELAQKILAGEQATNELLRLAKEQASADNAELLASNLRETAARQSAQGRGDLILDAIKRFYASVRQDVLLKEPRLELLRTRLLSSALEFCQKLPSVLASSGKDPIIQAELARALHNAATITAWFGSRPGAIAAHRRALAIRQALAAGGDGDRSGAQEELALSRLALGTLLEDLRQNDEAEARLLSASEILEYLAKGSQDSAKHPKYLVNLSEVYSRLGELFRRSGQTKDQMKALQRMVDTAERAALADPAFRRQLAAHLNSLGWALGGLGLAGDALVVCQRARVIVEQLVQQEPRSDELGLLLAQILGNIGGLQAGQGRSSDALASLNEAIAASRAVIAAWPRVIPSSVSMGSQYHKLGMLLGELGHYEEAAEAFHKARDVREMLARDFPEDPDFQDQLAEIDHNIGVLHFSLGHGREALQAYAHARERWERLAAAHPKQIDIATCLGGVYCHLGTVEAETLGHPQAGVEWCNHAVESLVDVLTRVPANAEARKFLVLSYRTRALALLTLKRHAEGRADLDCALKIAPMSQKEELRFTRAMFLAMAGEYTAAVSEARALANATRLPQGPAAYDLACLYAVASATAAGDRRMPHQERPARADDLAARAIAELRRAHAAGFFDDRSNLDHLDRDSHLFPLRSRPDYKDLRLDLAFPIDPFAPRR